MKKSFGIKTYLFPQPVLIVSTYDKDGNANAMNAAWGGVADDDQIMICLGDHKTTENLAITKACTVAMGDRENVVACDYVGIVSGSKVANKMEKTGWTTSPSKFVNAPVINELSVSLDCQLVKVVDDCKYLFKIVNVDVDERILTDGQIDFEKFHPICYDTAHHGYHELGKRVGNAFSDGKKLK